MPEDLLIRPGNGGVKGYFLTGTGRCGTMLLARLLSCGTNTHCNHENSISAHHFKEAYSSGNLAKLHEEVQSNIVTLVEKHQAIGESYGECSGVLYPVFPELYRIYGNMARFVLLVRRPDTFAASALARGFFNKEHPNALEHVRPSPDSEMGRMWDALTSLDKCLWYWNMVNNSVLKFFNTIPRGMWCIQRIEDLSISSIQSLYEFFQIRGFQERYESINDILTSRINASPGMGDERYLNPWSVAMKLGGINTWTEEQKNILGKWTSPLAAELYPEEPFFK